MSFGDVLRRLRAGRGWSQTELARRAGLKQQSIARWELNKSEPPWSAIQKLARTFGVEYAELEGEPPPRSEPKRKRPGV